MNFLPATVAAVEEIHPYESHIADECTPPPPFFVLLPALLCIWSTGSHNVHSLTLRQYPCFPVELLNVCVYENDKPRLGESWEGYEAFCE